MKNLKPLLIEALWLLGCITFTIIIDLALLGKGVFEKDIDINLHDTYFVIRNQHFLICLFIILSFFLYFIKENRHAFERKSAFFIFLILGLSFSTLITKARPPFSLYLILGQVGGQFTHHYQSKPNHLRLSYPVRESSQ